MRAPLTQRNLVRRDYLKVRPSPAQNLDFVVTHEGRLAIAAPAREIAVALRYVPDRLVLAPEAVEAYLAALSCDPWSGLEDVAVAALEDLNNELVARWLRITLRARSGSDALAESHCVVLEDRQPGWDNPALLAGIDRC